MTAEATATGYLPGTAWNWRHFLAVFFAGLMGAVVGAVLATAFDLDIDSEWTNLGVLFGFQVLGYLAALYYLSARFGTGNWATDYGLRFTASNLWGIPGGLALQIVVGLALAPLVQWLGGDDPPQQQVGEIIADATGVGSTVLIFIAVVVFAPLVEELLYRGLLLSWLRRVMPAWGAVAISALIFAGVHLLDPDAWLVVPGLFLIGLALGYFALRTGSLGLPIMLHAGVNFTAMLLGLYGDEVVERLEEMQEQLETLAALIGLG
jgi:membrane protease YdiL (CAAX protease family)